MLTLPNTEYKKNVSPRFILDLIPHCFLAVSAPPNTVLPNTASYVKLNTSVSARVEYHLA
jgi:hypothetical protein